jgi:hypothetical protein
VKRALLVVLLAACGAGGGRPSGPLGGTVSLILPAADGGEIDFTRMRGRLIVVHVFATWSLASQADVEQLDAIATGDPTVAVVGLAVDLDGSVVVPPWQRGSGATYPIALADDAVRAGRSPIGTIEEVPMTLILDRSGGIVKRHVGPLPAGALATWLGEQR